MAGTRAPVLVRARVQDARARALAVAGKHQFDFFLVSLFIPFFLRVIFQEERGLEDVISRAARYLS
jgi:hypothetical protein